MTKFVLSKLDRLEAKAGARGRLLARQEAAARLLTASRLGVPDATPSSFEASYAENLQELVSGRGLVADGGANEYERRDYRQQWGGDAPERERELRRDTVNGRLERAEAAARRRRQR